MSQSCSERVKEYESVSGNDKSLTGEATQDL